MGGLKKYGNPKRVKKRRGIRCYWCEKSLQKMNPANNNHFPSNGVTREHLIPRSQGGGGGNNIVHACRQCNGIRGDDTSWKKGSRRKGWLGRS